MNFFHNFTTPVWELFAGNLLFLFCSLFYLVWWIIAFRPNSSGESASGIFIMFAFLTGIAALIMMSVGINALINDSKALSVRFILLGAVALYLILLPVTTIVFHRQVTSELIIMLLWAALELSVITVLYGTGRFDFIRMAILVALVGVAIVIGLICYILYYRFAGTSSYIDGMVPLSTDAVVMAVILCVLTFS